MRIAVVQTNPVFGQTDTNINEALDLMSGAPADLYVLPELFNTGYNFIDASEAASLAEEVPGPTFNAIAAFATRRSCYVAYGFAEKADRIYNSAALVGPSGLAGIYRKVHLYARENLFFAPGNLGFPVWDLSIGRIGMMVCFDWYFPESARALAMNGAQIIAHPSNLVMPHCPDAMVTRCLENRVFAATANRVGAEDRGGQRLGYIGKSEIVAPDGTIAARLSEIDSGIAVVDINPADADSKRLNAFNDLFLNRRPDQYGLK